MTGGSARLTRRAMLHGIARCLGAAAAIGSRRPTAIGAAAAAGPVAGLAAQAAGAQSRSGRQTDRWDTIVVGAGVFGAWTAWNLLRRKRRVLLLDAWGPAHSRSSSGGESRATRGSYGRDEVYTRMAWDSLEQWRWLSGLSGLPVFHRIGVLFFFSRTEPFVTETLEVHRRLKLPIETLDRAALVRRFPQIAWNDVEVGLFEPGFGALMARRAVQTLVGEYVKAGGEYRTSAVQPLPVLDDGSPQSPPPVRHLTGLHTTDGELSADRYVLACGPWLPKVVPDVLHSRIFPTRQEVFFFAPAAGDARYSVAQLPVWADFNDGDIYYGFPDLEGRGFKIAHDRHGPPFDPDTGDRLPTAAALENVRLFMRRRFPPLADRPLVEARVCQYENSSNGDLLIDRHPFWDNVWLVGAGSGHGFKHGPAVGRYVADLVLDGGTTEPRFSLATKGSTQQRAVH